MTTMSGCLFVFLWAAGLWALWPPLEKDSEEKEPALRPPDLVGKGHVIAARLMCPFLTRATTTGPTS